MIRRSRIAICICISALSLSLLGASLGDARPPWKRAIASHLRADGGGASAVLDSRAARFRHGPALLRRRAVSERHRGLTGPIGKGAAPQDDAPLEPAAPATTQAPAAAPDPSSQPAPVAPPKPPAQPSAPALPTEPEPPEPEPPAEPPVDPAPPVDPTPPSEPEPEPKPEPEPEPPAPPAPTPEPPEPPKPVPPQPQVPESPPPAPAPLFDGDEIDDFANVQAAPNAITEVADPLGSGETVFRMTVDDDDVAPVTPTENPRAQALSPDLINAGDEIWLATKFMLPQSFPATVPGWLSLVEIYGEPFAGPSPWRIGISGDDFSWERNDNYGYDAPWRMPLVRDRWVSLLLHERFAGDGWVEMWIDGQQVTFFPGGSKSTERLQMATRDSSNNGGANHAKIMNYREAGMFETVTVYFGALKIGATRASVGG